MLCQAMTPSYSNIYNPNRKLLPTPLEFKKQIALTFLKAFCPQKSTLSALHLLSLSLSLNFARTGHQELCKGCPEKRKNNKRWVLYITSLSVWSITLVSPELSKVWGSQAQEVARNRLPQGLRVQLSTDWGWGERHWKFYDSWPVILRT